MKPKLISLQSRGNAVVRVVETEGGLIWVQKKMLFYRPFFGFVYSYESGRVFSGKRRYSIRDALKLASAWLESAAS